MTYNVGDMVIQDRDKPYVYLGIVVEADKWGEADYVTVLWLNHYPNRAMVPQQAYSNPNYYFKKIS
jgi:hypothetical protein